ncbi:MAG: sodium:panthothenate symporter, partial [Lentisphaeria bacterium]|nr:sodium:panthothenate symporter [Lentisphaeria bacterium]
ALTTMFYVLIAVCVITILNHRNYSKDAKVIRSEVASRIAGELVQDNAKRENLIRKIEALPEQKHRIGVDAPMGERHNQDTPYLNVAKTELQGTPEGNAKFQQFRTLFHQMTMAGTMRHILPPVMVGLFCLLMVLAMVSTDDTRIFSASLTISQDVVLPLIKKPLSPERHLLMIKLVSVGVGLIFLCGSFFMAQLDYIKLFVTVVGSMWMGGCGPVMVFGLYSRFGTAAGAWTSLVSGMVLSFSSILIQRNWADHVYPFLEKMGWVDGVGNFLSAVSKPFNPYIVWEMNAVKCPINSYEFYFITMIVSLILYVTVSYLTCREPFNLDKMLHRGAYHIEGQGAVKEKITWKSFWGKIIGITGEYSKGDKVIAWAVFFYCFVYGFGGTFLAVLIWNFFAPWKIEWWGNYFLVVFLVVPGIISLITTFWFGIGSLIDMRRLFTDLRKHAENPQDNGQVQK